MFEPELKALGDAMKLIRDLDQRVMVSITSMESRKVTLEKEITRLQADYDFHVRRNDEVKRAYQQNIAGDQHRLLMDQRAVKAREERIFDKEKELQQMRVQMETQMKQIQKLREDIEAERRNTHGSVKVAQNKPALVR